MESYYDNISIDQIELDFDNPRISRLLARYKSKEDITAEAIQMALCPSGESTFDSLYESIKVNGGVIHPIIVNKLGENTYIVIEGNTRVQIYKELRKKNVPGNWDRIHCIIYIELTPEQIHAIRLQSHLVGPRDWDPYSKAKYLNHLSNVENLPLNQIISFCGGKATEVNKMIKAYSDMQQYYSSKLEGSEDIDHRKFSAFVELQNKGILESIIFNGFTKDDFAIWVIKGNIDKMSNVRMLPAILSSREATKIFLSENATEAYNLVSIPGLANGLLEDATYDILAYELIKRLNEITHNEVRMLKRSVTHEEKKSRLIGAFEALKDTLEDIVEDDNG